MNVLQLQSVQYHIEFPLLIEKKNTHIILEKPIILLQENVYNDLLRFKKKYSFFKFFFD